MDAVMFSLFVTTASLDHQMSKLLQGSDQAAADAVKLLVDLVVAPLRTTLYVSSSQVLNWREYMQRYMPDSSTDIRDENDACEYGQILLEKVLLLEDLVRLRPDPRTHISGKEVTLTPPPPRRKETVPATPARVPISACQRDDATHRTECLED